MLDLQNLGSLADALVDLVLGHLAQLQTESHVLVNGHVRVQGVVLEDHCDIAVFRGNIVDQTVTDVHLAAGDLLQTGDHAQGGGLTAAGRTDENDKFLVGDLKAEIGNSNNIAGVNFLNVTAADGSHNAHPPKYIQWVSARGERAVSVDMTIITGYNLFENSILLI